MSESSVEALGKLTEYHDLLKRILAAADKPQVEEAARVLAAHVGYYQKRFGKIAMEETLASLHAEYPNGEQLAELVEGTFSCSRPV